MLRVEVPGRSALELHHLVLDLNGTVSTDGELIEGVTGRIAALSDRLRIHLVTADTRGTATHLAQQLRIALHKLPPGKESIQKWAFVQRLGEDQVVAIGNGANDAQMLRAAALGIAVLEAEGLASECLIAADIITPNIQDALDLLLKPQRLLATWRR